MDTEDVVKPNSLGLRVDDEIRPVEGLCRIEYLQSLDKDAENALAQQDFSAAVRTYTSIIDDVQSDLCKTYSKRSNVHVKMKCFPQALSDATVCIQMNPTWPMGYLRKAEAHKGLNDEYAALQCLVKGYNLCTASQRHPDDVFFLAEVIKTICLVSDDPDPVLQDAKLVVLEKERPDFIVKVMNYLASCDQWEAISLLVLGKHNGPRTCFDGIAYSANAENIPVGSLINILLSENSIKTWEHSLVTTFLKNGASVQKMETDLCKPAVHIGIHVALHSGQLDLLQYLFDTYIKTDDKRNAKDSDGNTGLHLLVQSEKIRSQLGENILDLLLKNNCSRKKVNEEMKLPIAYLNVTDKAYWMLYDEEKKTNNADKTCMYPVTEGASVLKSQPTDNYSSHVYLSRENDLDIKLLHFSDVRKRRPKCGQIIFCRTCDSFLEGYIHLDKLRTGKAYTCLANVLRNRGSRIEHLQLQNEAINMIVKSLTETLNPEIPKSLTDIPLALYIKMIDSLVQKEKYKQMNVMVRDYRKYQDNDALKDFIKTIDIVKVIRHSSMVKKAGEDLSEVIGNMLNNGAVLENSGEICIRAAVEEEHYRILCTLFDKGASPDHLSLQQGDTPIHAALSIALERDKENFTILEKMFDMFQKDPEKYPMLNPAQQDVNGDGLYHLAARVKYSRAALKATELLCERNVPAWIKNKAGKMPRDYIANRNDRRLPNIRQACSGKQTDQPNTPTYEIARLREDEDGSMKKPKIHRVDIRRAVEDTIFRLPDLQYSIFNLEPLRQERAWKTQAVIQEENGASTGEVETIYIRNARLEIEPKDVQINSQHDEIQENHTEREVVEQATREILVEEFDKLVWEVQCTAAVWERLCSSEFSTMQKRHIIYEIQQLANGKQETSKAVKNVPSSLRLFVVKVSKEISIIWELGIAFSTRMSVVENILEAERGGRIYSEIIRVWAIVYNKAQGNWPISNIVSSHSRGEQCITKSALKGRKLTRIKDKTKTRIPVIYTEANTSSNGSKFAVPKVDKENIRRLNVPANTNKTEHHALKFYCFSSAMVNHILQNTETKVDFPFLVTDLEHAIINIQQQAPTLLLGHGGTGKSTCCLYRLLSEFEKNWKENLVKPSYDENLNEETVKDVMEESSAPDASVEDDVEEDDDIDKNNDHLHQIFIAKNAALCYEIKERFRKLTKASKVSEKRNQLAETSIPSRIQEVEDQQYPLFITSKKLLLMLDASTKQPYFEKDDDGNITAKIEGLTDEDEDMAFLASLDEKATDELLNDIYDDSLDNDGHHRSKSKSIVKREITYEVFSQEVWPKISKKYVRKYHPSLIWNEIIAFIKGSFESLSKPSGCLTKQEYLDIGRKKAPDFSEQREHIYELFERYEQFKKKWFMFDKSDVVHNVYNSLKMEKETMCSIHQIYVDDIQEFTEAEMYLLIEICRDPNQIFLTGDPAHGIMRFQDLQSLFFSVEQSKTGKRKQRLIMSPIMHHLTHAHRYNSGILSFSSSIVDVMARFFPDKYDKQKKEQGFFSGHPPVLLESGNIDEIAVLLSGSMKNTSQIEFGAHQAIIVVDANARNNIPVELKAALIFTISEAKELEFDDILLYNFFKDSQVGKEWRVVTQYLEEISAGKCPEHTNIEVDVEILRKNGRPRPLTFDPSQHILLNTELKNLYTAVTRARDHIWIFDEDVEKRAPMFEYFKARKLVKTFTINSNSEDMGMVFAKSSSNRDWIKRGHYFMKYALFEIARKCFSKGGDIQMTKEVQAKKQAIVASRIKGCSQRMKDEFLSAARQFLDCNLTLQATKCLIYARERELLPQLYQKTGQLELAAEAYARLDRPFEVCMCYEQLGWYDKAIEILCKSNSFERALETLGRYETLTKQSEKEKNEQCLAILNAHAPKQQHTRKYLCLDAAEYYHETGNENRMLANLERLPQLADQIEFLKTHGYFERAAEVLYREKHFEESANLYLLHGNGRKAICSARQSGNDDLLARSLLVYVQVAIRNKSEKTDGENLISQKHDLIQHLQEAIDLALKSGNHDLRGEACFLKGELIYEITDINESWGAFNKSRPYRNEAGQLECINWMVNNSPLDRQINCFQVVLGMNNLFGCLNILLSEIDGITEQRNERIFKYFGLEIVNHDRNILTIYPQQRPRALEILGHHIPQDDNLVEYKVPKELAKIEICRYLLNRGETWRKKIVDVLFSIRQTKIQCPNFLIGIDCPGPCECKHKTQDKYSIRELLKIDMLLIELESYIIQGARQARQRIPRIIRDMVTIFMPESELNPLFGFKACRTLLNDLIPRQFQPWQFKNNVCWDIRQQVLSKRYIKEQILKYLRFRQDQMKIAKEKNTDVFLELMFLTMYFDVKNVVNTSDVMLLYENEILQDVLKEGQNKKNTKLEQLGFLVTRADNGKKIVMCVARSFCEGLYELTISKNVMASFIKFTRFITVLASRQNTDILPEIHVFLMWIEFYTVVGVSLAAKVNNNVKALFLPASYISTVHFIDSSYISPTDISLFALIQRHRTNLNGNDSDLVKCRFERLLSILCETNINLVHLLFKERRNRPMDYPVAERLLVLCMTCLCNMGWAINHDKEPKLMRMLCKIALPKDSPSRLVKAVDAVRCAEGQTAIAGALRQLLWERNNEEFRLCQWTSNSYGLDDQYLEDFSLMNSAFLHPDTPSMMANLATETPQKKDEIPTLDDKEDNETSLSLEEKQKHEAKLQQLQQYQKKDNASLILTRFFRHITFVKKSRMLKLILEEYLEQQAVEDRMKIFKFISVHDTMCGICDVQFYLEGPYRKVTSSYKGNNKTVTVYEQRGQHLVYWNQTEQSPRKAHEESPVHLQKNREFCFFKSKYKREIAPVKERIHDFVQKHQFRDEERAKCYYIFELEIQQLLNLQTQFHEELDDIIKARAWTDHGRLLQKSKEMESLYNTIKEYAESQYEALKEETESTLLMETFTNKRKKEKRH